MSQQKFQTTFLPIVVCCLTLLLVAGIGLTAYNSSAAEDNIVHVGGDSPDYSSVQSAVNDAGDNTIIVVHKNRITETVKIGSCSSCPTSSGFPGPRNITIRGAEGVAPIVQTGSSGTGIYVADNNGGTVRIEKMAFDENNVAVKVRGNSRVIVTESTFSKSNNIEVLAIPGITRDGVPTVPSIAGRENFIPNDPTLRDRVGEGISDGPVIRGFSGDADKATAMKHSQSGTLTVRPGTDSFDSLTDKEYGSLQTAVRHASYGATIEVHGDSHNYGTIEIQEREGGTTIDEALTIRGIAGTPQVNDIITNTRGTVRIRNMHISGDVAYSGAGGSYIDAKENWWGETPPDTSRYGSSVSTQPFCTGDDCSSTSTRTTSTGYCLTIENTDTGEESSTCSGSSDEVRVTFSGSELTTAPGFSRAFILPVSVRNSAGAEANVNVSLSPSKDHVTKFGPISPSSTSGEKMARVTIEDRDISSARITVVAKAAFDEEHTVALPIETRDLPEPTEELPTTVRDTESSISDTEVRNALINAENTTPARFDDAESGAVVEPLERNAIPPSEPRGDIEDFGEAKLENGIHAALIPSGSRSTGDLGLNTGIAFYTIPEADTHTLHVKYQLQAVSGRDIDVHIVDSTGSIIDPSADRRASRSLGPTVSTGDTVTDPTDSSAFTVRNATIELSEAEETYINENAKAYVTFSAENTDGLYRMLLFHTYISSNDTVNARSSRPDRNVSVPTGDPGVGTFDISYTVAGTTNPRYGSFDLVPGQPLRVAVSLENNGDTIVEHRVGLISSDYTRPSTGFSSLMTLPTSGPGVVSADMRTPTDGSLLDATNITVPPGETKTVILSHRWQDWEFGTRTISVRDITTGESVTRSGVSSDTAKVYVKQPATLRVVEVNAPDYELTYDSFNVTAKVQNVGDLSGSSRIELSGGSYSGVRTVSATGGDARAGRGGIVTTVKYSRAIPVGSGSLIPSWKRDYTPPDDFLDFGHSARVPEEPNGRARAPFSHRDGPTTFTVAANNSYLHPSKSGASMSVWRRYYSTKSWTTETYKMEITVAQIYNPTTGEWVYGLPEGSEFYASPYPYVRPHGSVPSSGLTVGSNFGHTSALNRKCSFESPGLPLTREDPGPECKPTETKAATSIFGPIDKNASSATLTHDWSSSDMLIVRVRVSNPHDSRHAIARLKAVTKNRSVSDTAQPVGIAQTSTKPYDYYLPDRSAYGNNTVGVASSYIAPEESEWVYVPIVLRNDPGNNGTFNITIKPRSEHDYIRLAPSRPGALNNSSITGASVDQFTFAVNISADYSDIVFDAIGHKDASGAHLFDDDHTVKINEICTGNGSASDEGHNPPANSHTDTNKDYQTECTGSPENVTTVSRYGNYGSVTDRVTAKYRYHNYNSTNPHSLPWMTYTRYDSDPFGTWLTTDNVTLSPDERVFFNTTKRFREPGYYYIRVSPQRDVENSQLRTLNNPGWTGQEHGKPVKVKVWDTTPPVAGYKMVNSSWWAKDRQEPQGDRAFSQLTRQDRNSNPLEAWEDGTLRFDGSFDQYSEDNVNITEYKWTIVRPDGSTVEPTVEPGDSCSVSDVNCYFVSSEENRTNATIRHRFKQPGNYTLKLQVWDEPRLVKGNGSHTNITAAQITVQEDKENPYVNLKRQSPDQPIWHRNTETDLQYGGDEPKSGTIIGSIIAQQKDSQIGIEADRWTSFATDYCDGCAVFDNDGDIRKRTWEERNVNYTDTINYEAWDLAGNHNETNLTVNIYDDDRQPLVFIGAQGDVYGEEASSTDSSYWAYVTDTDSTPVGGITTDIKFHAKEPSETGAWYCDYDFYTCTNRNTRDTGPFGNGGVGLHNYTWSDAFDREGEWSEWAPTETKHFTSTGTRTVTLTVMDRHENTQTRSNTVDMRRDTTAPRITSFSASATGKEVTYSYSVEDESSYSRVVGIDYVKAVEGASYDREWSSHPSSASDSFTKTYSSPGNTTVKVKIKVWDAHGNTDTATASYSFGDSDGDGVPDNIDECPPNNESNHTGPGCSPGRSGPPSMTPPDLDTQNSLQPIDGLNDINSMKTPMVARPMVARPMVARP